jgi:hypothetical protein
MPRVPKTVLSPSDHAELPEILLDHSITRIFAVLSRTMKD